jgi:hypothetical protein
LQEERPHPCQLLFSKERKAVWLCALSLFPACSQYLKQTNFKVITLKIKFFTIERKYHLHGSRDEEGTADHFAKLCGFTTWRELPLSQAVTQPLEPSKISFQLSLSIFRKKIHCDDSFQQKFPH